jgi:hypothetical protein
VQIDMGLMDKAKEAALQAKASAEKVAQQGQARVASVQQGREESELYKTLGDAYFKEQRKGGDHGAVASALAALDAHFAAIEAGHAGAPPPPAADA